MQKMAFAHVFGSEKKNGFGPFSYKFFVCIRVGLIFILRLNLVLTYGIAPEFRGGVVYRPDCPSCFINMPRVFMNVTRKTSNKLDIP